MKIGVFAPSSYVERDDIEKSIAAIEASDAQVFVHPQSYLKHNQSAGTHEEKLNAMHTLYADESIDMIWAAGGGNRCLHILDGIDLKLIKANPKPMAGFSDVTALLNFITAKAGIVNIHTPVFRQLSSKDFEFPFPNNMPLDKAIILKNGKAEGKTLGGNLSLFQYLIDDIDYKGAIIFLEDCNEELSRIDRMIVNLKRRGVFETAAGIVFGQFTDLADSARPFGFTIEEIIKEHIEGLDIPIVMNAPFGHGKDNEPFSIGAAGKLDTVSKQPTLTWQSV